MSPPTTIAHYRISSKLGEGGMGAVYRATDTKLGREVAIKVLPDSFATDPDRLARFTREAQVLASLNHPNIAAIYGVEDRALVMELVPGPTLAERTAQGAIPVEEALPIARQIADALEYAHERGVVHRDLKPANLKVTPEGRVKVLDFGLAKALSSEALAGQAVAGDPSASPTLTMRNTLAGVIIGTAAYMPPEQAKGKPVDRRADIWAFGVVLLEMLTGRQMYRGETATETLAAVIMMEPDLSGLPAATPVAVRRLLQRCLRKDPLRRLRDIGEARIALDEASEEETPAVQHSPVGPATGSFPRRGVPLWAALPVLAALVLGIVVWRAQRPGPERAPRPMMRFSADLGPEAVRGANLTAIISPDGTRLAFSVRGPDGMAQLATRLLDQSKASVLAGTEGALDPFFSPDGQWIGFFADSKMKKISVQGGTPFTLCETTGPPRGADWGDDGNIIASLDNLHLFRVPAAGGKRQIVSKPEDRGERTHRWPQLLPGSETVLFTAGAPSKPGNYEDAHLEVLSFRTGQVKIVQRGGYFGRYVPSGHLIYVHQGVLFAIPFDLERLETRGMPAPVLENVAANPGTGGGQFDFSKTGTLAYLSGKPSGTSPLIWMDPTGKTRPLITPAAVAFTPSISPDGKRLAFSSSGDISVYEPQRDATTKLTFTASQNRYPLWMPDGQHMVFGQWTMAGGYGIWWIRTDGSGQPEKLFGSKDFLAPTSLSPDGRRVAFGLRDSSTVDRIWTLPLDLRDPNHPKPGSPEPFPSEPDNQWDAAFSPDGLWLAYTSFQPAGSHVFVRPFPASSSSGKWLISSGPGRFPIWSSNGRELFYLSDSENRIMVATYTAKGDVFSPERPRLWSPTPVARAGSYSPLSLAPDGKRFVVFSAASETQNEDKASVHVSVLLNFFDDLRRRVPTRK